ncbi:4TM region of DNA translocase FtsK/SpoIIIE [Acididesulfobacillus acetoxydans]|uniref:4TM region of DNA translocase FtsK/SpoIIIE n=1 Tax=Acididesulfobacillus acetoxydans TaxID=1561005 RepID=A0A8S0XZI9_9FIRM|nr:4TM region of DNA translocase FtsK/SpoIIIE [Acididesulfobacillus acetoxydans]CEJ05962.1 DNA translocase SpoIIIE [Acididesulfobacillus acetoxydans]
MAKKRRYRSVKKSAMLKESIRNEAVGLLIVGAACLGLVTLFSGHNGIVGAQISRALTMFAGGGRVFIPIMVGIWGLAVMNQRPRALNWRVVGGVILFLVLAGFLQLQIPGAATFSRTEMWQAGKGGHGGGLLGALVAISLETVVGTAGSYIVLVIGAMVGALLVTNHSLVEGGRELALMFKEGADWLKNQMSDFVFVLRSEPKGESSPVQVGEKTLVSAKRKPGKTAGGAEIRGQKPALSETPVVIRTSGWTPEVQAAEESPILGQSQPVAEGLGGPAAGTLPAAPASPKVKGSIKPPGKVTGTPISRQAERDTGYVLPSPALLHQPIKVKNARLNKDLADNVKTLEETLDSFGVKIKVTHVTQGPAITRYEAQPAPGIKVSRITNLADDIALSLAASDVRIEAPVPGKSVVGIEVPNKEIATVHFREVLEAPDFQDALSKLSLVLGKDITGMPVVADLTKMPHLLIAGATGSGKSVCINTLINSILFKARPNEVKFLLVDPKMVELANYNGIPHLIAPVVTDPRKAAGALKWIVTEMETRYELFAANGVRDIVRYNYVRQQEPDDKHPPLPYVVVIIDELSDLMMVAPGDVEDAICRLAQMARAAGIHLIVATQRPSVDVITGLIKANIPSRIAFAVSSQTDSRTIIDMNGAEKLLGRGDMLFYPMGAGKPLRVQGCFLADKEVENVVRFLQNQAKPEYQEIPNVELGSAKAEEPGDELFHQAAELFIESGNASVSLLQRRLRIGYTRAARLMDLLEEKGVVGGYEGSKAREVLLTRGQFAQKFGSDEGEPEEKPDVSGRI